MLEHMADPGLDRAALERAFSLDDPAAGDVVRLLIVEALSARETRRRSREWTSGRDWATRATSRSSGSNPRLHQRRADATTA